MKRKVIPLNDFAHQIPLLQTKLLAPRTLSSLLVERPRISIRLDEMQQGRLTLVTAPAGFGKTTAVAEWIGQRDFPAAWLSLDSGDNDPVRFWAYVAAALKGLQPGIGTEVVPILNSSTSPPWEAAISLLIDDLSRLSFDATLVLDDYHIISEPLVHETLSFLVRYAPRQLHLVITGRFEPPLSLPRLRATGQVAELTSGDLSFVAEEAASFYRQRHIELIGEEIARLTERTGGWAAGMQMAALSLKKGGDMAAAIERFGGSDHLLAGYFQEEVLAGFAPDVQSFLLQTSILGRLCGPLCEAVTGVADGTAVLAAVSRSCGFVTCLDDWWYAYHHLFAEFLRGLLKERYPGRTSGLYSRAARWCEDEGLVAEAVDYYLQEEEYGQAAVLIERLVPEMLAQGEMATLFRWLADIPSTTLYESPGLCVAQGWVAMAAGRTAEVEQWLERADAACRDAEERLPGMGGKHIMMMDRSILRAYLAVRRMDVPEVLHYLIQAGQTKEKNFLPHFRSRVFPTLETSLLVSPLGGFGHLKEKARAMKQGVPLQFRSLVDPAVHAGYIPVANGETLYEWNQIDEATRSLLEGMEEAQRMEEAGALVPAVFTLTRIRLWRGDLTAALAVAAEGEKSVRSFGQHLWLHPLAALKARLNLAAGDASAVDQWLSGSRLDIYDRLSAARIFEHITLGRVLLARGRLDDARLLLERLLVFAEKEQRLPNIIEISNLLAIARAAAGQTAEGLSILRRNLALGRENGYLRSFVDEGTPMLSLLRKLSSLDAGRHKKDERDYIRQIVALLHERPAISNPVPPEAPAASLDHHLTARQLAVLRLLADGMANQEIAEELAVTVATVKTHVSNICGKLGVSSRRQAVRLAKQTGII